MYADKFKRLIPYRLSSLYSLAYCMAKRDLSPKEFRKQRRNSRMLWEYVDELLEVLGSRKETMPALHPDHNDRMWNQLTEHLGACISFVTASAVTGSKRRLLTFHGSEHAEASRMCLFYDARNQCYHVCTDETMFLESRSVCIFCGEQISRRDNLKRHHCTASQHYDETGEFLKGDGAIKYKFRPIRFRPPLSLADRVDEFGDQLKQKYLQYSRRIMLNPHMATFDVGYL